MHFYVLIVLLVLLIPFERRNRIVNYFRLFICSFICFYYLNQSLVISIISFLIIIRQLYWIVESDNSTYDNSIYNLAHEVKNPLAVCKGYLDMIDLNDKEKIEKYIPIIKKEMNRSLDIMNNFLDLKKIGVNKELMDLSLLLEDINESFKYILKDNDVRLIVPDFDKEIIVDGDYDKLKQVFINIIKNSYEADAKNIKINIKKKNRYLNVDIIDDGRGISNNDLKKIGEIFYTTKVDGNGIGISMSKKIVKLHGGDLMYNSVLNKGTIATIKLPLKYMY